MYKALNTIILASSVAIVGCGSSPSPSLGTSSSGGGAIASSALSRSVPAPVLTTGATAALSSATTTQCRGTCGDVNGDGAVNVMDALLAAQIAAHSFSPTPCQERAADVDGNGTVTILDALMIASPSLHARFNCRVAATIPTGPPLPPPPAPPTSPDSEQECQKLWSEEPFVSGSLQNNHLQVRDESGNVLATLRIRALDYFDSPGSNGYFELDAWGILVMIRNWTGRIFDRTTQKAVFQSYPHVPFGSPRGDNAFYAAPGIAHSDLRSGNAPTMNEWSIVCGYDEIGIGKLFWINLNGEKRILYYLVPWVSPI